MKTTICITLGILMGCGSDNDVDVKGGTTNTAKLEYRIPICEDPIFDTAEAKLRCIEAVTTIEGKATLEDLTVEELAALEKP